MKIIKLKSDERLLWLKTKAKAKEAIDWAKVILVVGVAITIFCVLILWIASEIGML